MLRIHSGTVRRYGTATYGIDTVWYRTVRYGVVTGTGTCMAVWYSTIPHEVLYGTVPYVRTVQYRKVPIRPYRTVRFGMDNKLIMD